VHHTLCNKWSTASLEKSYEHTVDGRRVLRELLLLVPSVDQLENLSPRGEACREVPRNGLAERLHRLGIIMLEERGHLILDLVGGFQKESETVDVDPTVRTG